MTKKKVEVVDETNKVEEVKEVKEVKESSTKKTSKAAKKELTGEAIPKEKAEVVNTLEVDKAKEVLNNHADYLAKVMDEFCSQKLESYKKYEDKFMQDKKDMNELLDTFRKDAVEFNIGINKTVDNVTELINSLQTAKDKTHYYKIGTWAFAIIWFTSLVLKICGIITMPWFWVFFPLMLVALSTVIMFGLLFHYIKKPFNELLTDENIKTTE